MPPFIPRKRLRSFSLEAGPSEPPAQGKGKVTAATKTPRKATLFDDIDAGIRGTRSAEQRRAVLESLAASDEGESSLSSLSDEEFEDVPLAKRQKITESEDEDEDMEFEDVPTTMVPGASANIPQGDLELNLTRDTRISITNPFGTKKGPTKIERQIRVSTHQAHVQLLMWHNAIRNSWLCDKELQEILVKQLSPKEVKDVEKWRRRTGIEKNGEHTPRDLLKGKGKGRAKTDNGTKSDPRSQRDWGEASERLDDGQPDPKGKDPLVSLLTELAKFWKRRFTIRAPGLRKIGYMSLQRLDEELKSFNQDEYDPEQHGEMIRDIDEFRECAKSLEGSRDVAAQLFTALLRGLGIEARMIASLQPAGFGWSQFEEAFEKNPRALKMPNARKSKPASANDSSDGSSSSEEESPKTASAKKGKLPAKRQMKTQNSKDMPRGKGVKEAPIELSESEDRDESDADVVDVTPMPKQKKPLLPYDKDLPFPHYWTEAFSPFSSRYIPVEAIVFKEATVADSPQTLEMFETRGSKSEKAKQVTAYIVGHSADGTAKDVTTRYLKRHVWPGRTKGFRFPVEKIPIHNRKGKIARYEYADWFKTVMSGYVRGSKKCPRTEIDDLEDTTDLKPVKPEKKQVEEGKETLQYYKTSPDFVLERHLKREEALVPTAKHVKMFPVGKGDAATEEKVFLRKDVVNCKSTETWHKEGRAPKPGEEPLKRVPYRAATTNRKRVLAEAEHASGEKMLQGLFSLAQTEWIIPPPIENGIIPKNSFGNIDLYVDSMLPEGAVHIPMRGTVKICKRLEIDYAEAVTGFEFGHRMAVPIITGVVVAEEHYHNVMDEWQKEEVERNRKEDEKRRKAAIFMWRKMLMALRIVKRVREEYGDANDEVDVANTWTSKRGSKDDRDAETQKRIMDQRDEEMAGGFLPEGYEVEEPEERHSTGFFPVAHHEEEEEQGGGFVVEGHGEPSKASGSHPYPTPQSLESSIKYLQDPESEEDVGTDDEEIERPPPKKRGRPAASATKTKSTTSTPRSAKPKKPAKRTISKPKSQPSSRKGKARAVVEDSELENDTLSSLSDLDSDSISRVKEEKATKSTASKRTLVAKSTATEGTRKTPRRNAKRSEGIRSKYFDHSGEDVDE